MVNVELGVPKEPLIHGKLGRSLVASGLMLIYNHRPMFAAFQVLGLLALSILKTNFIIFHSKKLKPSKLINLKIDGLNIKQVFTVKYLGVTFDLMNSVLNYQKL